MPAMHLKSFESDLPVCRWKQAERNYEVTTDLSKVTCRQCIRMKGGELLTNNGLSEPYVPPVRKPKLKIQFSVVGENKGVEINWPEGWPIPRVDEELMVDPGIFLYVRHVCYYPSGEENPEPFVYVVVGPRNMN